MSKYGDVVNSFVTEVWEGFVFYVAGITCLSLIEEGL